LTTILARRIASSQVRSRRPLEPEPPDSAGVHYELWADISNYTGPLTDEGCADLKAAGYVGVIVQAITGLDGNTYTRQQLEVARRNGLRLAGYVWCFPGASEASIRGRLGMFDGFELEFLALDVEQAGTTILDVERDLKLCNAYIRDVPFLYSGKWFFDQQGWSHLDLWADHPLWDSNYDGEPDADVGFRPYGGWTEATIKQFRGTSRIGHVDQIDLNVRRAA
jgi:hypothetical protein